MPKAGYGMIAFGNGLGVFGGYGVPREPTEPQSFIKDTRSTDGSGWTNEFHIYNLSEGNLSRDFSHYIHVHIISNVCTAVTRLKIVIVCVCELCW